MTREIVKVDRVTKVYATGGARIEALREVSLSIGRGELTALAGPSGSGKSTLLNVISVLDRPTAGRVWVDGVETSSLDATGQSRLRRDRIGFVFQSFNLVPVLTALENAEYVLMLQGHPARQRRERVMAVLEAVGLGGLHDRFPRELSGGQQQRVAIARAIAAQPALVLADEPTANLDSKTGASLLDLMVRLNEEEKVTFLFSTHDPAVVQRARRRIVLHDGRVESDSGASPG